MSLRRLSRPYYVYVLALGLAASVLAAVAGIWHAHRVWDAHKPEARILHRDARYFNDQLNRLHCKPGKTDSLIISCHTNWDRLIIAPTYAPYDTLKLSLNLSTPNFQAISFTILTEQSPHLFYLKEGKVVHTQALKRRFSVFPNRPLVVFPNTRLVRFRQNASALGNLELYD